MKLSARNVLKGKIVEVKKGQTTAHVRIDIGGFGCYGLDHQRSRRRAQAGQRPIAYAVIKASDVMIAID